MESVNAESKRTMVKGTASRPIGLKEGDTFICGQLNGFGIENKGQIGEIPQAAAGFLVRPAARPGFIPPS
jgi:hypothetical protein